MSRKIDEETRKSLEIAINTNDGVFETIESAINWYFEHNEKDDPRKHEDEFISWDITIGCILDDSD